MGQPLLNSLGLLVLGSGLTFVSAWFWFRKNQVLREAERIASASAELTNRVIELEAQLGKVGQAILPINAAFQAILIKELTHFHTPEMDALLEKLGPPITLTPEEEQHLIEMLQRREKDMDGQISDSERDAAHILPVVMQRVKVEQQALLEAPTQMQVVAVTVDQKTEITLPEQSSHD